MILHDIDVRSDRIVYESVTDLIIRFVDLGLKQLLDENGHGSFDFIFIDADKTNYMNDHQLAVELIRSDGLIAIDNTLWHGKVIDLSDTNEDTIAIREINHFVRDDQRVDISFLRFGDGTTLCRKK